MIFDMRVRRDFLSQSEARLLGGPGEFPGFGNIRWPYKLLQNLHGILTVILIGILTEILVEILQEGILHRWVGT